VKVFLLKMTIFAGFGWTAYFTVPLMAMWLWHLIAQGQMPDFAFRDVANLGGFAVFAWAMYRLHVASVKDFREDMKAEREIRDKLTAAIQSNTAATERLTARMNTVASRPETKGNP
jgi:hypothetical protein